MLVGSGHGDRLKTCPGFAEVTFSRPCADEANRLMTFTRPLLSPSIDLQQQPDFLAGHTRHPLTSLTGNYKDGGKGIPPSFSATV